MTEFKVGDIVRMTKGEPDKPGYEQKIRRIVELWSDDGDISLAVLGTFQVTSGWTVELIERPAPPLPTKPNTIGWATVGGGHRIVRRNHVGTWSVYDEGGFTFAVPDEDLSDFTEAVLIPKDLADEITAWADNGAVDGDRLLNGLADHLKGQDNE